jgi:hypothetical protein
MTFEMAGKRMQGMPRKTWMEDIKNDLRGFNLKREDAQYRSSWKKSFVDEERRTWVIFN